ncbi:two-component sensor histidine kinase, partial [Streptosporangium saharense]
MTRKRRSLRSRLTLLVTTAVAVAIAVCAAVCWFIVRSELIDQMERSLGGPKGPQGNEWIARSCSNPPPEHQPPFPRFQLLQAIDTAGVRCVMGYTGVRLVPDDRVVAGAPEGVRRFRDGVTDDGAPVLVLVRSVGSGLAVMESRPLAEFQSTLTTLAWILAGVAALGVVGAASAGLLISRTATCSTASARRPTGRSAVR